MLDSKEDFEIFDQLLSTELPGAIFRHLPSAYISSSQEPSEVPEAMVLQRRKDTSLLELLESHTGGSTLEVVFQPQPPTLLPIHTSPFEQPKKKRKREKKGKETSEEGEIASKDLEP